MESLSSTIDKTIGLVNGQLDLIARNTTNQTNIADQLRTASELAGILQILTKAQASQENYNGQAAQETQEEQTKIQKTQPQSSTLKDIFNDTSE